MKTTIYIIVSALFAAVGIIILQQSEGPNKANIDSFAISVIAGGLASLWFAVIRIFDDKDAKQVLGDTRQWETKLYAGFKELRSSIQILQVSTLAGMDANRRCIFSRNVTKEVGDLIQAVPEGETIKVDVIGLSLHRFYLEQFQKLNARTGVHLRMIVQNPLESTFAIMVRQEGRDFNVMKQEILTLSRLVLGSPIPDGRSRTSLPIVTGRRSPIPVGQARVELRWLKGAASVTFTRVNEVLFVRPRFLNEGRDAPVFFERYHESEEQCYSAYNEYFDSAWEQASVPTQEMLQRAEAFSMPDFPKSHSTAHSPDDGNRADTPQTAGEPAPQH